MLFWGAWNEPYLLGCLEEHLEHLGRTKTGTSVHRCVRDAREEVVAVDGPADAVKKTVSSPFGQEIEGTVLIHVVVVFALMANNTKDFLKRNLGQRNLGDWDQLMSQHLHRVVLPGSQVSSVYLGSGLHR